MESRELIQEEQADVRLDPEVLGEQEESKVPLSDLYKIPVFSKNTADRAGELENDEKRALEQIRYMVFTADRRYDEDCMREIRKQVFRTDAEPAKSEFSIKTEEPAEGQVTEPGPKEMLTAGIMMSGILLWFIIYRRDIKKRMKLRRGSVF